MVFTATSNPKSRWPLLCHILSSLCYGPVCFASPEMEEKLTDTQRVIGSLQIVVAVMNLVLGLFGIIFFIVNNSPSSIVMPVLQLCVALSFCVLTIKSLFKKGGRAKLVENTTSESTIGKSKYSLPFGHSCGMTLALTQVRDLLLSPSLIGLVQQKFAGSILTFGPSKMWRRLFLHQNRFGESYCQCFKWPKRGVTLL